MSKYVYTMKEWDRLDKIMFRKRGDFGVYIHSRTALLLEHNDRFICFHIWFDERRDATKRWERFKRRLMRGDLDFNAIFASARANSINSFALSTSTARLIIDGGGYRGI